MNNPYERYSRSKHYREERLQEARSRHLIGEERANVQYSLVRVAARWVTAAMLLAAIVALAGAKPAETAFPEEAFPSNHSPIAFEKDGDIWVANKMHLANLTPDMTDSNEVDPSVSPTGKEITFASDQDGDFDVYTISVFGGEVRQVTHNGVDDRNPVWSPDGRWITYAARYYSSPTHAGIFAARVDDTHLSTAHRG